MTQTVRKPGIVENWVEKTHSRFHREVENLSHFFLWIFYSNFKLFRPFFGLKYDKTASLHTFFTPILTQNV